MHLPYRHFWAENFNIMPLLKFNQLNGTRYGHTELNLSKLKKYLSAFECDADHVQKMPSKMLSGKPFQTTATTEISANVAAEFRNFQTYECKMDNLSIPLNEVEISASAYFRNANLKINTSDARFKSFTRKYIKLKDNDKSNIGNLKGINVCEQGITLTPISDRNEFVPFEGLILRVDYENDNVAAAAAAASADDNSGVCSVKMCFLNSDLVIDKTIVKIKASIESDPFDCKSWIAVNLQHLPGDKTVKFYHWFVSMSKYTVRVAFRHPLFQHPNSPENLWEMNVECEENISVGEFADIFTALYVYYNYQFANQKGTIHSAATGISMLHFDQSIEFNELNNFQKECLKNMQILSSQSTTNETHSMDESISPALNEFCLYAAFYKLQNKFENPYCWKVNKDMFSHLDFDYKVNLSKYTDVEWQEPDTVNDRKIEFNS